MDSTNLLPCTSPVFTTDKYTHISRRMSSNSFCSRVNCTLTWRQVIYLQNIYIIDCIYLVIQKDEISVCLCHLAVMQIAVWFKAYSTTKMFSFSATFVERILWVGKRFCFIFFPPVIRISIIFFFFYFLLRIIRCSIHYIFTQKVQSQKKRDISSGVCRFWYSNKCIVVSHCIFNLC